MFDDVHGSDGTLNLRGRAKADFLVTRYGAEQFTYVGDSRADLPVWMKANRAITVNANASTVLF